MSHISSITLFSILCVASALSCSAIERPDSITVTGKVSNIPPGGSKTIIINECDISHKSERRVADLDSSGYFCERIPFSSAHTFTVNYTRNLFVNAFAEPGDSIHVEIDASASPLEFHLSGDHSEMNEEYSHAFENLKEIYNDVSLLSDTVPLADYMKQFKSEVTRKQAAVSSYISDHSVSEYVARMLMTDNVYSIANQAIGFRGKSRDEQLRFFTDPFFDILNEDNARVMIFPYHLSALCRQFPDYISSLPKSHIRDLMYATCGTKLHPERDDFHDPAYYERLYSDNITEINAGEIRTGDIIVLRGDSLTTVSGSNPVEYLNTQFAGRPIYLDLSATWCGPCRAAIASSEGVRSHFKDSEIVFVICWLKSDMESWKKLTPTIHNAIQIFVTDDDMSNRMMDRFQIHGFPSYYFITPQGKIYHDKVPTFNSCSLSDFLKARLTENTPVR